jgi:glycosyltransferase involved in cell wall biosynthesis
MAIGPIFVILPIHNEQDSISYVLDELIGVFSGPNNRERSWQVVLSEDGSQDRTREILTRYVTNYPENFVLLEESSERLGYSRAVIRGLSQVPETAIACVMDSDGQCDPRDLPRVIDLVVPSHSVGVGSRRPRIDGRSRLVYSRLFGLVFTFLFKVRLDDPSSPIVAIHGADIHRVLDPNPSLEFGYWWEFQARCKIVGLSAREVAVTHRARRDGLTRVYRVSKLPRIAISHVYGLFKLKRELAKSTTLS